VQSPEDKTSAVFVAVTEVQSLTAGKVEEVSDTPKITVTDSVSWYLMGQTDTVLVSCKADATEQLCWKLPRALTRLKLSHWEDNW